VISKKRNSQILVNLPVTNAPPCIGSNEKTGGLKYLRFPDIVHAADLQMGGMQDSRGIRIIIGVVWEVIVFRGGKRPNQTAEARSCYQEVREEKNKKRRMKKTSE
jgi:hypothetical protein